LSNDRVALIHLAPVILGEDFLGTVSILRDVTHEVEVDRLKSEFVATVSHELRTPMTSIKGYVEMLLMGAAGAVNENQSHFLDIIRRNIDRLNTLVDGLLDISRIEAGKASLSLEALDLTQVAGEAIGEMQRKADEDKKPMSFSLHAEENVPPIRGDAPRVRQVVLSVLSNAYHYTLANGSVRVEVHASRDGQEVELHVADNGVGIRESDRGRIFERFFRGDDPLVLETPGAGLGLAIAKQLVEMHGGRIWFESEGVPGQGSTFSIAFPASQVPHQATSPESPQEASASDIPAVPRRDEHRRGTA
jgi:signal transduction histidine kinase